MEPGSRKAGEYSHVLSDPPEMRFPVWIPAEAARRDGILFLEGVFLSGVIRSIHFLSSIFCHVSRCPL